MPTIINTPAQAPADNSSGILGTVVGIILLVVAAVLFFAYGLPAIRSGMRATTPTQQQTPPANNGAQIQIPDKVDVNVNRTQ